MLAKGISPLSVRYLRLAGDSLPGFEKNSLSRQGEGWAAVTAAAGDSAPAGDAPPIFFLRHQKENAPRPVEKKTCSAGRPAQAQPSCRRRGKVGSPLRQSETETRRPWGNLQPGEVQGYPPAPLPAAAHAPAKNQAAPGEAEGAEREAGRMHPCTPTLSAPSATGQQSRPRRR